MRLQLFIQIRPRWCCEERRRREERQRGRYSEKSTTAKIGNMKIMAVYQPLWSNGREGVERYREEIEEELAGSINKEVIISRKY